MKRSLLLIGIVALLCGLAAGQVKCPAEKLVELPELDKNVADDQLVPIWKSHKCDSPEVFYVITYGTPEEFVRRSRIIYESIGRRCDYPGFRAVFIDATAKSNTPLTVVWRAWPDGERPQP